MQLIDNNTYMSHCQGLPADQSRERAGEARIDASGRLLVLLSSGLLIVGGPTILDTVAQASLSSLRILLEICHFGLVASQIFGR
jgi:hypothetical protein